MNTASVIAGMARWHLLDAVTPDKPRHSARKERSDWSRRIRCFAHIAPARHVSLCGFCDSAFGSAQNDGYSGQCLAKCHWGMPYVVFPALEKSS